MAQDFATKKPRKKGASKRIHAAASGGDGGPSSPLSWFFTGLLCGVFISGLVWLASLQPEVGEAVDEAVDKVAGATIGRADIPKPRFDFYTLLSKQNLDVDVDSKDIAEARINREMSQYLLQAGSFRQPDDADRRRAELLLLDLDAKVEQTSSASGVWHRVFIGPFQSRSKLAKARSLTAQQGIDTLLLKKPAQG